MKYGDRLKTARQFRQLSQDQLSEISGVKQGSISKIERGGQEKSTFDIVLAEALDIHPAWLNNGNPRHKPYWLNTEDDLIEGEVNIKLLPNSVASENTSRVELTTLRIIDWHEISTFLSSNNSLEGTTIVPITINKSADAYGIKMHNSDFSPYVLKDEVVVIEPKRKTLGQNCLVDLNGQYVFMKHRKIEREYLQYLDGTDQRIPLDEALKCRFIGVVTYIIPAVREG